MTHINRIRRLMLMSLCLVLSGCVSVGMMRTPQNVPLAPEKADTEAKHFKSKPGRASIYVIREDAFKGQAALFQVSLDGKDQGKLSRGTYFLFMVPPGKHVIDFTGDVDKGTETIYAVEGGMFYLEIKPKSGIIASATNIFRIDKKRGRQLVLGGRRAEIKAAD